MQYIIAAIAALTLLNLSEVHDRNEMQGYPDAKQEIAYKYNCDTTDGLAAMIQDLDDETINAICEE